jgi:hypothetical protein
MKHNKYDYTYYPLNIENNSNPHFRLMFEGQEVQSDYYHIQVVPDLDGVSKKYVWNNNEYLLLFICKNILEENFSSGLNSDVNC